MEDLLATLSRTFSPTGVPDAIVRALQDDAYADAAIEAARQGGSDRLVFLVILLAGRSGGVALPRISRAMDSQDSITSMLAAVAWWRLTGDEVRTLATLRRRCALDPEGVPLALDLLGYMGASARGELSFVAGYLNSEWVLEALVAIRRIGDVSDQTLTAIDTLARSTTAEQVPVFGSEGSQREAIRTLLHLGPRGRGVVMQLLASSDRRTREAASEVIDEERTPIEVESFLEAVQVSCAGSIGSSCPAAKCVVGYIHAMSEEQFSRLLEAVDSGGSTCILAFLHAVTKGVELAARHYRVLARRFANWMGDGSLREDVLTAWVAVGPAQREPAEALLAEARSAESVRRSVALRLLGQVRGEKEDEAGAVLAKAVTDASPAVRAAAAEGMRAASHFRSEWIEGTRLLLEDADDHVRTSGYEVVEAHAQQLKDLLLEVKKSSLMEVGNVRIAAARAAWVLGVEDEVVMSLLLSAWRESSREGGRWHEEVVSALRECPGREDTLAMVIRVLRAEASTSLVEGEDLRLILER